MDSTNEVVAYLNQNLYSENKLIENDITQIEIVSSEKPQKLTNGCKIFKIYNDIRSCSHFLKFLYRIYQHQQSTKRYVFFPVVEQIFKTKDKRDRNYSNFLKNEIFLVIHKNQFSIILPLIKWEGENSDIFKKVVYYQYVCDSDETFYRETIDIILSFIDPMKKHEIRKLESLESLENNNQADDRSQNDGESVRLVFLTNFSSRPFGDDKKLDLVNKLIDSRVNAILCPVGGGYLAANISQCHSTQIPTSDGSSETRNMPVACFGIDLNNKQLRVPENIFEYHLKFLIEILYEKDLESLKDYNTQIRIENSRNTDNNGLPDTIYYEYCSPTYQYSYLCKIIDEILIDIAPRSYHSRVKPDKNPPDGSYLFYFAFVSTRYEDDLNKQRLAELINANVKVVLCFFGNYGVETDPIDLGENKKLNPVVFRVINEKLKLPEEYQESIKQVICRINTYDEK